MDDDVINLLKAHEYFRGVSDTILGEIARFGTITSYDAAAVVHQLNDPLTSICFILRGRLKSVRVDSRGEEHLFQIFERGDQYGMILGGLGDLRSVNRPPSFRCRKSNNCWPGSIRCFLSPLGKVRPA